MRAFELLVPFLLATTLTATTAAEDDAPSNAPKAASSNARVIESIELFTQKNAPFKGSIVVGFADQDGGQLAYYWGGKCEGSIVTNARVSLLYQAMRDKTAIEVPGKPIRVKDSVHMCMSSFRLLGK